MFDAMLVILYFLIAAGVWKIIVQDTTLISPGEWPPTMRHGQDRDSLGDEEGDDITDCGDGVTVQYSTVQYSTVLCRGHGRRSVTRDTVTRVTRDTSQAQCCDCWEVSNQRMEKV